MTGLRSGIVGTGFMGQVHARAVRASGGILAGVAGRSIRQAEQAALEYGAERALTVEQLVDEVDIVHICTPNHLHHDQALLALEAGKHVICEKPLSTDLVSATGLLEAADRAGVVTAVPFAYRFYPAVRSARARVASGQTGPLRLIHGTYLQDWLARPGDESWRVDPLLGGASRAFADIGVHWCDLVELVSGHRISRLSAELLPGDRPTEDGVVVQFATDRGALGSLVVSQVSPGRKNRLWFSLDGTEESVQWEQESPEALWVGGRDLTQVIPRGREPGPWDIVPVGHPQGYQDCFTALVTDVHSAIRGEVPDGLPTFADGHRAAVLTDAVLRSAAARSWIEV